MTKYEDDEPKPKGGLLDAACREMAFEPETYRKKDIPTLREKTRKKLIQRGLKKP